MPAASCLNQIRRPRSSNIIGPPRAGLTGRGAAKMYPGATPWACLVTMICEGCRSGRVRKDLASPEAWASDAAEVAGGVAETDGGAASAVPPGSPLTEALASAVARVNTPTARPARRPGRAWRRRDGCREGAMGDLSRGEGSGGPQDAPGGVEALDGQHGAARLEAQNGFEAAAWSVADGGQLAGGGPAEDAPGPDLGRAVPAHAQLGLVAG